MSKVSDEIKTLRELRQFPEALLMVWHHRNYLNSLRPSESPAVRVQTEDYFKLAPIQIISNDDRGFDSQILALGISLPNQDLQLVAEIHGDGPEVRWMIEEHYSVIRVIPL